MGSDNLTARLANLSPAKRALLELRLRQSRGEPLVSPSITRRPAGDTVPLSFAQQRLWFLNQLEPESAAYNESSTFRLSGILDLDALKSALNQIVLRHEVLRTVIVTLEGSPRQMITNDRDVDLPIIDLRAVPTPNRDSEAQRLIAETIRKPFDLSHDLPLRVLLLQLGEQEHLLVVVKHHIASDGWSSGIFWRELTALYRAFAVGKPSPLPELPIQYSDYAVWQREWLQGQLLERQLSYWKKRLDSIGTLQLPTDRPRPSVRNDEGRRQTIELSKQLSRKLGALSRPQGATLFMTLLAAFQALLYRYTGQEDIAVGCPIAGRTRQELEGLIGFFVNTLVLRVDFSGNPTFRELLARVRARALEAYGHQDLPFEKLVGELQPERNLSYTPLFQVAFAYQNTPAHELNIPGLVVTPVERVVESTKFDLHLSVNSGGEGIVARLHYATDLYDDATITRLLDHWRVLLEAVVENPDRPISDLSLLTAAEKQRLLVEWNGSGKDHASDKRIHELFEEQVERTPDAIAVILADQRLSYRELNRRANQLAHYLRKLGVGPGTFVAICVDRSLAMVVGLLGILKAGGAYVPLDPDHPKDRLAFALEDTKSAVLLTQAPLVEKLSALNGRFVCLDRDWPQIGEEKEENPENEGTADDTAYIIYTSGTTGQPKGVVISHHNVSRLFRATEPWFHFSKNDVWTVFHSYAFDFSVWELWGALLYGGKAAIVPYLLSRSPAEFYEFLCREKVTILSQTPSAFRQLIGVDQTAGHETELSLRSVILGGEALDFQSLQPWFDRHGDECPLLINMYGITETTVHVTYRVVKAADLKPGIGSLIGVPIPDLELYVLDKNRQLVPIGVPGELYVGGAGVGRGYLNQPELTAERFLENPFSQTGRLYKTGDLVRRLSDGDIEYLGRSDDQVKIRGFRIEPGEIEAALSQHPGVTEAVVLAREEMARPESGVQEAKPPKKRLVAYVVPRQGVDPVHDLRNFLKAKLPDYMVPSTFVFLDSLPLTPNGKTDRKALPEPDQRRPELEEIYVAPRTAVEETIASIWAEVLRLGTVGVHDDFFDLGGHSLLATQAISRICQSLRVEVPLRALFEGPTVAQLARSIEDARTPDLRLSLQPLAPVRRDKHVPLSFSQQRLWFLDQYEPNSSIYNLPGVWRLRGCLDVVALERSLNEVVRRHESLRTTFSVVEGEAVQVIVPSVELSLAVVDLSDDPPRARETEAQRLANEEARLAFDLAKGPLFRSKLLRVGEDDHVLLLTMHHIVSDGWSMGVLHRELSALYRAFVQGQAVPLGELSVQYADYAVWQREWLRGEVLNRELLYWKQQLEGIPAVLNLPTDRPRPAVQSFRGARQSILLSKELTGQLKALSRKEGVTLFMTLLAAFQTLLYRYTGQEDIVVGSPIANRHHTKIEGLIGFFVNTLVLRTRLSGDPTFKELLAGVKETTLGAYDHPDLPFEKLVEELNPERSLSHSPLFQVMFVLQNTPQAVLEFEDLCITSMRLDGETAKFDLILSINELEDGLQSSFEYATDLFDEATILRMMGHFRVMLEGIVVNSEQRLSQLPILTETEAHQLLILWNSIHGAHTKVQSIHELFEEQVQKGPDNVAVVFEEEELSYRELNERANRAACYLIKKGVGPDVLVPICMSRSVDMLVGILAILKAGGAYVPLDPSYPKERLALILDDVGATVLLTQPHLLDDFAEHAAHAFCLDESKDVVGESGTNFVSGTTRDNLAYVLHTSGSTGMPKGVAMNHGSLLNLLAWQLTRFTGATQARTLQFAPLSFDVSFQEIFATWCAGGTLLLIPEELRRDAVALWRYLGTKSVERLFLPVVALQQLAEAAQSGENLPDTLREVITAGEQLQVTQPIVDLFSRLKDCKLHNQYGPTESHVVTALTLTGSPRAWPRLPSIGRPISNTQIYILDSHLSSVPIGVAGELYIGGDGLARGYLNRPELTADKFIPNPFSTEPGARLYKTGDLARYLPDGNIEFQGRIDQQVKIRGFRVELGEIEAVLRGHPQVSDAVMRVWGDGPGDKRLVGYVVTHESVQVGALRNFLKEKLPDYMVPSTFVFLDSLPLTPNGKTDRKALPAPDQHRPELEENYVAPRTPTEETVAEIWAEVLKLSKVGVHDNFFELGGHSLLATQLVSRIRERLLVELPLQVLFENATVAGVADHVEAIQSMKRQDEEVVTKLSGEREEIRM